MKRSGRIATAAGALLLAGALFVGLSSGPAPQPPPRAAAPAAEAAAVPEQPPAVEQSFPQPEQAALYQKAMLEGNQRALEVVTRALEQTRAQPGADPQQIADLESEVARRRAILGSLTAAR